MLSAENKRNAKTGVKLVMILMIGYILAPFILSIGKAFLTLAFQVIMIIAFVWLGLILVTALGSILRNLEPNKRIKFNEQRQADGKKAWNGIMTWLSDTFTGWKVNGDKEV